MLLQALNMKRDRFRNQSLNLRLRCGDGNATRKVGNVGAEAAYTLFDDNGILMSGYFGFSCASFRILFLSVPRLSVNAQASSESAVVDPCAETRSRFRANRRIRRRPGPDGLARGDRLGNRDCGSDRLSLRQQFPMDDIRGFPVPTPRGRHDRSKQRSPCNTSLTPQRKRGKQTGLPPSLLASR